MKIDSWMLTLDKINKMNSHVKVTYSAREIKTKTGIIQELSTRGIKIDDKFISYRLIVDVTESEEK